MGIFTFITQIVDRLITPVLAVKDLVYTLLEIPFTPRPRRKYISRFLIWMIALSVKHLYGPERVDARADEVIVLCLVRDGEEYISTFIEHYLALGVKHIIFLDNHSEDNTVMIAGRYNQITILQTRLPFRTYHLIFKAYLRDRFSPDCWCLYVDSDELFNYPFSDRVSLKALVTYLNEHDYNAVLANMLEMFSDKPLDLLIPSYGNLKEEYRWYDLSDSIKIPLTVDSSYRISNPHLQKYKGGIRTTAFGWTHGPLWKYSLFFLRTGLSARSIHDHHIQGGNTRIADFSTVLFHYKFTGSLYSRCLTAIEEKNHARDSAKYQHFYQILSAEPDLNLKEKAKNPKKLTQTNELISQGFLVVSERFRVFADQSNAKKRKQLQ